MPQFSNALFGLGASILIVRNFSQETVGIYSLIFSIIGIITGVIDFGRSQVAQRYLSTYFINSKYKYITLILWFVNFKKDILFKYSGLIILVSCIILYAYEIKYWFLYGLITFLILSCTYIYSSLQVILISSQNYKKYAIIGIIFNIINILIIALVCFFFNYKESYLLAACTISSLLSTIISFVYFDFIKFTKLSRKVKFSEPEIFDKDINHSFKSQCEKIFYSSLIVLISSKADIFVIGLLFDVKTIAIYSVALKYSMPMVLLFSGLSSYLTPKLANLSDVPIKKHIKKYTLLIIPLLIYSIIFPFTAPNIFGLEYIDSIYLAQILCLKYVIALLYLPFSLVGYNKGFHKTYVWLNLYQLLSQILIIINTYEYIGIYSIAIAMLISEFITVAVLLWKWNSK